MLKKEITYHDLDDNEITETFWFNMSQSELAELALGKEGKEGGFENWVRNIQNSNDGQVIIDNFKKILLSTVGQRSADNKSFMKSDEIRESFQYSDAYTVLFMELVVDAEKMAAFINGVVPAKLRDQVQGNLAQSGLTTPAVTEAPPVGSTPAPPPQAQIQATAQPKDDKPAWYTEGRVPTEKELIGASSELMMEAFRRKSAGGVAENGA